MFFKVTIQISELHISLFSETYFLGFEELASVTQTWGQYRSFKLGNLLQCYSAVLISAHAVREGGAQGRWGKQIQRLSAEHLFQQPSCGPSPGPIKLHLVWEANCSPGGVPTCQLTVGLVPLRIRADTFWHRPLEHFFNLMAETWDEEMRKHRKEKKMQRALLVPGPS